MSASKGLEIITAFLARGVKPTSFGGLCIKGVKYLSAGDGNCKAEFTVGEEHLNPLGTLHGGYTASLIDSISTLALITKPRGDPGISIDINVSFLKTAFPGEVIIVDARTIKAGRNLAFLEVEMLKKEGGAIVARGQHTKFMNWDSNHQS